MEDTVSVSEKEHTTLLKQFKGTDRRYRLTVLELNRLYKSFDRSHVGLARFSKLLKDASKDKQGVMVLKYLILVHGIIQYNSYSEQHLELLLQFNPSTQIQRSDEMQEWLAGVIGGYFKYLSKISFHGDIYQRSVSSTFESRQCIVDLFMILNQLNSYVHQAKTVFNCAGRYYNQKLFQMEDFFNILQNQYTNLYILLSKIIRHMVGNYEHYSRQQLESFIESFTQLDNINDSMEDLLRNKHYQKPMRFQFVQLSQLDQINILNLIYQRSNRILE